jgi:microcystin-dependent protein
MATPFIGHIQMFAGNFAPQGRAFCNGQLLAIDQNTALFALIGTIYGGDGQATFALPNLQGRLPLHQGTLSGNTYSMGQSAGAETVTLTSPQMPNHTHPAVSNSGDGGQASPSGGFWGLAASNAYSTNAPTAAMNPQALSLAGGNQPHENMSPFLCVNFVIALEGIFPSRN